MENPTSNKTEENAAELPGPQVFPPKDSEYFGYGVSFSQMEAALLAQSREFNSTGFAWNLGMKC